MVTIRIGERDEDLTWEQWERRVREGRVPESALVRFEPVTGDAFVAAGELDLYQSLRDDASRAWSDRFRAGPPPWMTALLAGVQIRLWWLLITSGDDLASIPEATLLSHARVFEDGQVWRLVSMGFLHLTPLHLLANMAMFLYVGWNLERALGRLNLLTIFLASITFGSVVSLIAKPGVVSLGASGGVLGVVAAATVFGFVRHNLLSHRARVGFGWALLPYLALVYFSGWTNETTDNWAHTGGLVTGGLLALVLDPPGLQRRPGWAWMAPAAIGGVLLATLGLTWAIGPRALAVADVAERTPEFDTRRIHREIVVVAPSSWQRGTVLGRAGFTSRATPLRGWAVRQRELAAYEDVDAAVARVRDDLTDRFDGDVTFDPPEPVEVAGAPGRRLTAHVGGQRPVRVEVDVAVRGLYTLEALFTAEEARFDALAPLRDRCAAGLRWDEPTALVEARAEVRRSPQGRAARRQLAEALGMAGEAAEARALWEALIAEQPTLADGWAGLLALEAREGGYERPPAAIWERALAASQDPALSAEVAASMHSHGEIALAVGVLELAWARAPGDRSLRRVRLMVGVPVAIEDQAPAHLRRDPRTGAPLDAPSLAGDAPVALDAARAVGEAWQEDRRALAADATGPDDGRRLGALLLLHRGLLPDPETLGPAVAATLDEVSLVARGTEPRWMPAEVTAWIQARNADDPSWTAAWAEAAAASPEGAPLAAETLAALGLRTVSTPRGAVLARVVDPAAGPP